MPTGFQTFVQSLKRLCRRFRRGMRTLWRHREERQEEHQEHQGEHQEVPQEDHQANDPEEHQLEALEEHQGEHQDRPEEGQDEVSGRSGYTASASTAQQVRACISIKSDGQWSAIYQPLEHVDSLRLIRLEPCFNKTEPIKCTMIHGRLTDDIRYLALSYEWGAENTQNDPTVLINDNHLLRIRRNLYEALKEIQASSEFSGELLWVDAICINQQKAHGEKPHQVQLMGRIFAKAAMVIAWLGVTRSNSDMAIDALKACSRYGCVPSPKYHCFITSFLQPPAPDQSLIDYPPYTIMKAIEALCNRSYWRRVWIMQEIQLSRSLVVRCGSHSITDRELEQAFDALMSFECIPYMRYTESSSRRYYRELTKFLCVIAASVPLQHLRARKEAHRSLGQLLHICVEGNFRSTESRDYIFALLGISNDVAEGIIEVDYEKPLRQLRTEALPIIERSYCSVKPEDRKSWDSFCQEFDQLLFDTGQDPLNEDEASKTALRLLQRPRALPGTLILRRIPGKSTAFIVQAGGSGYDTVVQTVVTHRRRGDMKGPDTLAREQMLKEENERLYNELEELEPEEEPDDAGVSVPLVPTVATRRQWRDMMGPDTLTRKQMLEQKNERLRNELEGFELEEEPDDAGVSVPLEECPAQWSNLDWFEETFTVRGFSFGLVAQGSNALDAMMDRDSNDNLTVLKLTLRKRKAPFAEGALRVASYARTKASTNRYVVKTFKGSQNLHLAHVVEDMRCQTLCKAFALEFNALLDDCHEYSIDFLVSACFKRDGSSARDKYMSIEPYLDGQFVKYNTNSGWINDGLGTDPSHLAAQAFSHFTYERSRGRFLVCDLQGVGGMMTDPAVQTLDPERFNLSQTNLASTGFRFFFATHECNALCRKLDLKSSRQGLVEEMRGVGSQVFREDWPAMPDTVCCSNKLCGRILRRAKKNQSEQYPGYHWCDECLPQLEVFKVRETCTRPGKYHEFEVSQFFFESQG